MSLLPAQLSPGKPQPGDSHLQEHFSHSHQKHSRCPKLQTEPYASGEEMSYVETWHMVHELFAVVAVPKVPAWVSCSMHG